MKSRVTIKDIAAEAGVSTGTVHRALYGKKGISDTVRHRILDICAAHDYQTNTAASALKRGVTRIAAAFPGPQNENTYFYSSVWRGFHHCMAELRDYNLEVIELPYYSGTINDQASELNACFERYAGKLDALITIGPTVDASLHAVQQYSNANIPVFLACDDAPECGRIACVQANYVMTGRIAAELLANQIPSDGTVLICAGDILTPSHYRTAAGFEAYLHENKIPLKLLKINGYTNKQELSMHLSQTLTQYPEIQATFSVSARLSVLLAEIVAQANRSGQIRIIASDLFNETIHNSENGLVQNIIYKNPTRQAYLATKIMGDYILRGITPHSDIQYVESRVIFKSNLEYYKGEKDNESIYG